MNHTNQSIVRYWFGTITWERVQEIAELACDSGSRETRNIETGYASEEHLDEEGKAGAKD